MTRTSRPKWKLAALKKRGRQAYVRLLRSPGAPREVAGGMALGLFVAMMPVMGLQMPIAIVCAELLRRLVKLRLSRVAAAAGVWLTNPVTAAPLYGLAYVVGLPFVKLFSPGPGVTASEASMAVELGSHGPAALQVAFALIIGGVVLGVPIAALGYWITSSVVTRYQSRRAHRRARAAQLRPPVAA